MALFSKVLDAVKKKEDKGSKVNISPDDSSESVQEKPLEQSAPPAIDHEVMNAILSKLQDMSTHINSKIDEMHNRLEEVEKKLEEESGNDSIKRDVERIDNTLKEFSAVYELISNQYNPFLEQNKKQSKSTDILSQKGFTNQTQPEKIIVEDAISKEETHVELSPTKSLKSEEKNPFDAQIEGLGSHIEFEPPKDGKVRIGESFKFSSNKEPKQFDANIDYDPKNEKEVEHALDDMSTLSDSIKREIIDSMLSEKIRSKALIKEAPHDQRFHAKGSDPLASLLDLVNAINSPKSPLFHEHVGPRKDHFADWIEHVFKLNDLASSLRQVKQKDHYIVTILSKV